MHSDGCAASTAASNMRLSRSRGVFMVSSAYALLPADLEIEANGTVDFRLLSAALVSPA
jgi:hypothetical protein